MLYRICFFIFLPCLLWILGSCSEKHAERQLQFKEWIQNNGKIKILSTTAMINELVKEVGGSYVDTLTLIQGDLDPHSYQLVKGDDEKLTFAQIIFYNGLGLEHGPSLYHHLENNPKAISVGNYLEKVNSNNVIYVEGQKDPHIWMDISIWAQALPLIVEILTEKDPVHAFEFNTQAEKLKKQLTESHEQVKQIMHEAPEEKRYLVTSHDAFNYFTRAYLSESGELVSGEWQKRFAAPEGLAPESQLSTTHIRAIIHHMKKYQIHLLFPESNVSQDSIKKILQAGREEGLDLQITCCPLYSDAMGGAETEADTYVKMLIYNAKMISSYMKNNKKDK